MDVEREAWIEEGREIALATILDAVRIIRKCPEWDPEHKDTVRFLLDDSHFLHQLLGLERPFLEDLLERIQAAKEATEAEPVS